MMKIIKIGFAVSALAMFMLSCKTTAQTTSDIKSINYTHTFGRGGATSVTATPDSIVSSATGGRTQEFPNLQKKIMVTDWQKLVSGLNTSVLEQTVSGPRRGVYDGPDQIFRIITKDKEYEIYNVPTESPGYKQLEKLKTEMEAMLSRYK